MKIRVDTTRCCSSGMCVMRAPEIFDQDENDGLVKLITDEPAPEYQEAVIAASLSCPVNAIMVED